MLQRKTRREATPRADFDLAALESSSVVAAIAVIFVLTREAVSFDGPGVTFR